MRARRLARAAERRAEHREIADLARAELRVRCIARTRKRKRGEASPRKSGSESRRATSSQDARRARGIGRWRLAGMRRGPLPSTPVLPAQCTPLRGVAPQPPARHPLSTARPVSPPFSGHTCLLSAQPAFLVPRLVQVRHSLRPAVLAVAVLVLADIKEHVHSLRVSYTLPRFAMKSIAAATLFASVVLAQSVSK